MAGAPRVPVDDDDIRDALLTLQSPAKAARALGISKRTVERRELGVVHWQGYLPAGLAETLSAPMAGRDWGDVERCLDQLWGKPLDE